MKLLRRVVCVGNHPGSFQYRNELDITNQGSLVSDLLKAGKQLGIP
jgi:hypothetical protein